jgi:hypothetical protein
LPGRGEAGGDLDSVQLAPNAYSCRPVPVGCYFFPKYCSQCRLQGRRLAKGKFEYLRFYHQNLLGEAPGRWPGFSFVNAKAPWESEAFFGWYSKDEAWIGLKHSPDGEGSYEIYSPVRARSKRERSDIGAAPAADLADKSVLEI